MELRFVAAIAIGYGAFEAEVFRAGIQSISRGQMEAARSLGMSRRRVWWRVTWPVARPAVVAGCALAMMETLADFGTVAYFSVDSFTAGIYRAWQGMGDRGGAARLSAMLLTIVIVVLAIERGQRGRMQFYVRSPRPEPRRALRGAAAWRATLTCALPVVLGFALPAMLLAWAWLSGGSALDARLLRWIGNTALLAACGAAIVLPVALVAAYSARVASPQWSTRMRCVSSRSPTRASSRVWSASARRWTTARAASGAARSRCCAKCTGR